MMNSFQQVVNLFQTAITEHLAINSYGFGTIDKLDSTFQNVEYPYGFLRPLTSNGLTTDDNGVARRRELQFELFMMDIPKLTESDYLGVMSDCEQYIYDILGWFNLNNQSRYYLQLISLAPVNEAFNDRVYGFVATINYVEEGNINYCDYPSL